MVDNPLYFKIKGTTFLQCGLKRKDVHSEFEFVHIKNCNTNTYKWVKYDKFLEILKNSYNG